jgi:hypothetical protein
MQAPAPPLGNVINLTSNGPANVSVVCPVEHQVALSTVISFARPGPQAVDAPAGSTCALSGAVSPVFTTVTPDTCDFGQACDVTVAQNFGRNVTNAMRVTADDSECVKDVLAYHVGDVPTDRVVQGICHKHRP